MDYQNRVGSKKGSGGIAGSAETNQYRRERVKNLLQSKISIESDPYVLKNRSGIYECKLCLTTHLSESSYITHTTGRKHQVNLMRRAESDKKQREKLNKNQSTEEPIKKRYWKKIGKPYHKVTKIQDQKTLNKGLIIVAKFENIKVDVTPMYKFLASSEQKKEPEDPSFQYLVLSAEPYENIAIKIPSDKIDFSNDKIWDYWDPDTKEYCLQFFFLNK